MKLKLMLAAVVAMGGVSLASAETVTASQSVEKIVVSETRNDGSAVVDYVPADRAAPGETLLYTVSFTNERNEPATPVVLTQPVASGVVYKEGSAMTPNATVTFSVDNGETFLSRSALQVTEGTVVRPARAEDITHIRWTLNAPVASGESGSVSFAGTLQ